MGIGLVADIPDDAVVGGVEDVVEGDGELDDAEAGAEMAAGDRDGVDGLGAQLRGELGEIALGQLAQIRGNADAVEEGKVER